MSPEQSADFETQFVHYAAASGAASSETVIASYHLLELIGHGGMGEVWLAEQKEPIRRRVALKLIKAGMDTREVVARFESERQALALMDHPAIARVFDAGSTPQGRPFFVMEYVTGSPITDYCDQHKLTTRQRLELFVAVCDGVQHAHQKAILHRDLKPSNILVHEVDGKPVPKIIDFGIAKATSPQVAPGTMFTQFGAIVGTPGYMSPEQADSAGIDVDTRTDVYSLGVVLYELLVGTLPLDFQAATLDQFMRRLRDEDSPAPSTRLRTLGQQITAREIRGDLDAIALKALERDRARRYATPSDLAADIGRFLRNEPILARPASTAYRARKYVRRHRLAVTIATSAALLLILVAVAQAIELRRIRRERDRADRVTDFMTGMFKVADPSEARGNDIRAREVLDKASKQIETGLSSDPELQAQMMHVMGGVYDSLGLYAAAEPLLDRAVDIRQRVLGARNPDTLQSMSSLADILRHESHYDEAEKYCRRALDLRRAAFGSENRDTLNSMSQLAFIVDDEGRYPEAEKLNREVIATAQRKFGPRDPLVRIAAGRLAIDLSYEGKYKDAERAFRDVLDMDQRQLGPEHPKVLGDMNNLAASLLQQQRYPEAEKMYRDSLDVKRRVLGPEHPDTLLSMGSLALVLADEKRYTEAEKLYRETLEIKRRKLGPEHRSTLVTMSNLAETLASEEHYAEAEKLLHETLDIEQRKLGPEHSDTLVTMYVLSQMLKNEKRYAEAEQYYKETLERQRRALGVDHPDTATTAYDLACVLALEGKRDEAFSNLRFALDHGLSPEGRAGLLNEPDFKSLHADARFADLLHSGASSKR